MLFQVMYVKEWMLQRMVAVIPKRTLQTDTAVKLVLKIIAVSYMNIVSPVVWIPVRYE